MVEFPVPLQPMAQYRQFILWKAVPRDNGKWDKFPLDPNTLEVKNAHDTSIWLDGPTALGLSQAYQAQGFQYYVGFVFTENDPFFFLDIDNCVDMGQWSQQAIELTSAFTGCAVETSFSGKGLHIFGVCDQSIPHKKKSVEHGLELYTEKRFCALTLNCWEGGIITHEPGPVYQWFVDAYMPPGILDNGVPLAWTTSPVPEWSGYTDDTQLITAACEAKGSAFNPFGEDRMSFADLWYCNEQLIFEQFPHDKEPFDRSSAEMSLAMRLAFWTGKNCERIERLMMQSGLVRDKLADRQKYRQDTILKACAMCQDVHRLSRTPEVDVSRVVEAVQAPQIPVEVPEDTTAPITLQGADATHTIGSRYGSPFMSTSDQLNHFKGCVYVRDKHTVITPGGYELDEKRFRVQYGGFKFCMDDEGAKTTDNAFEAFARSMRYDFPKVDSQCFRPDIGPGIIVKKGNHTAVNGFFPAEIERVQGDPTPFVNHMRKLFPVDHDFQIIMNYLATCVQKPGHKIQWCPVIQGCEGNGKSLITRVMSKAVGEKYYHMPNAQDLSNKFNGWIERKLLIVVEEIYTRDKRDLADWMKPMITNERVEIQCKGTDQYTGDNRANFILMTNHIDAMKKSRGDRRYCIFYTGQQSEDDIIRDGMDGDYFPNLYDWLKGGGYAVVAEYLHTYPINPEYCPATRLHRAPKTSCHEEVLDNSKGFAEQHIEEAIHSDTVGFKGGYVSSIAVSRVAKEYKFNVNGNRLNDYMTELGYIKHPALPKGRSVLNSMFDDSRKPHLYVIKGHPSLNGMDANAVSMDYISKQGGN